MLINKYGTSGTKCVVCKFCGETIQGAPNHEHTHYIWEKSQGTHGCNNVPKGVFLAHGGTPSKLAKIRPLHLPLTSNIINAKVEEAREKEALKRSNVGVLTQASFSQVHNPITLESSNIGDSLPNVVRYVRPSTMPSPNSSSFLSVIGGHERISMPSQVNVATTKKRARDLPRRQTTLAARNAPRLNKEAQTTEHRFFYQSNLAFHIARCPAYHKFYNSLVATAATRAVGLRPVNLKVFENHSLNKASEAN